jgi:hypothetical protein
MPRRFVGQLSNVHEAPARIGLDELEHAARRIQRLPLPRTEHRVAFLLAAGLDLHGAARRLGIDRRRANVAVARLRKTL